MIQLSDLEKDAKLVPRYHHKALLWLIDEKLFDPAGHTSVQSLTDEMQDNLEKTSQRNRKKKENRLKAKPQRTIFQWVSSTASSSSTGSPDVSESSQGEL